MTDAALIRVLFLCTGNSARSILGEAILNRLGSPRFAAFSAGSQPKGAVNPGALRLLDRLGYPIGDFRSKSWAEFATPGAPAIDIILTVCANAAGEACPVWPGHPTTAHWGLDDPASVTGDIAAIDAAFSRTYDALSARIEALVRASDADLSEDARARFLAGVHASLPA
jgi:arsenate reductase